MPIDISFIRSPNEGGIPHEIQQWQTARIPKDATADPDAFKKCEVHVKEFITMLQELEQKKRYLLKEQSEKRAHMKRLQKSLAPNVPRNDADGPLDVHSVKNEIRELKSDVIPSICQDLDATTQLLNEKLVKLHNLVDTHELPPDVNEFNLERNECDATKFGMSASDPLFCIGGCESISIPSFEQSGGGGIQTDKNAKAKEKFVLCGIGSELSSAMNSYAKDYFQDWDSMHLPRISLSPSMAYDALGCAVGCMYEEGYAKTSDGNSIAPRCDICEAVEEEELVVAPSYITFAMMNQNQTFHDNVLPKISMLLTQSSESESKHSRFAHEMEQIEIAAITVNNIHVSRALQDDIALKVKEFYCSLISKFNGTSRSRGNSLSFLSNGGNQIIRLRLLEPWKLDANEARRICVEGYLPSKGRYEELSIISNCTSFVSRSFKMKCGGTNNNERGLEFVHLVHGMIYQESAIAWVLENNLAIVETSAAENSGVVATTGIMIPATLNPFLTRMSQNICSNGADVFIPFVRTLTKGKGGKLKVQKVTPEPKPILFENRIVAKKERTVNTNFNKFDETEASSTERVSGESICNPWGFLPLYQ